MTAKDDSAMRETSESLSANYGIALAEKQVARAEIERLWAMLTECYGSVGNSGQ